MRILGNLLVACALVSSCGSSGSKKSPREEPSPPAPSPTPLVIPTPTPTPGPSTPLPEEPSTVPQPSTGDVDTPKPVEPPSTNPEGNGPAMPKVLTKFAPQTYLRPYSDDPHSVDLKLEVDALRSKLDVPHGYVLKALIPPDGLPSSAIDFQNLEIKDEKIFLPARYSGPIKIYFESQGSNPPQEIYTYIYVPTDDQVDYAERVMKLIGDKPIDYGAKLFMIDYPKLVDKSDASLQKYLSIYSRFRGVVRYGYTYLQTFALYYQFASEDWVNEWFKKFEILLLDPEMQDDKNDFPKMALDEQLGISHELHKTLRGAGLKIFAGDDAKAFAFANSHLVDGKNWINSFLVIFDVLYSIHNKDGTKTHSETLKKLEEWRNIPSLAADFSLLLGIGKKISGSDETKALAYVEANIKNGHQTIVDFEKVFRRVYSAENDNGPLAHTKTLAIINEHKDVANFVKNFETLVIIAYNGVIDPDKTNVAKAYSAGVEFALKHVRKGDLWVQAAKKFFDKSVVDGDFPKAYELLLIEIEKPDFGV